MSSSRIERVDVDRVSFTAGDTVGVVDEVIKLRVQWPGAADLTLVDLPGIVRVALEGQAEDIEAQVKNMIDRYGTLPASRRWPVTAR